MNLTTIVICQLGAQGGILPLAEKRLFVMFFGILIKTNCLKYHISLDPVWRYRSHSPLSNWKNFPVESFSTYQESNSLQKTSKF